MYKTLSAIILFALPLCAQVTTTASWIGNTFSGPLKWIQTEVADAYVTPDGTVYTNSIWDEGQREAGAYKNGDAIINPGHTHGWGAMGGKAVTANSTYLYLALGRNNEGGGLVDPVSFPAAGRDWYGVSRRALSNVLLPSPFPGGTGGGGDTLAGSMLVVNDVPAGTDAGIAGLAADEQRLYVSNPYTNQILVYDAVSMAKLNSFPFTNPGKLTVDRNGTLWIIQATTPRKILHYSTTGTKLAEEINDVVDPTSIAIDNQGRLMIGEGGPALQVRFYDISAAPALAGTFGVSGGIYSGTPGEMGDNKLAPPTGIGTDSDGNIYVASTLAGTDIRKFSANGNLIWRVLGLEGVDVGVVDPASGGADVYTKQQHFTMDYSKPAGQQWTWKGLTTNAVKYPNDFRLAVPVASLNLSALGVRNISGNKYLFLTDQLSKTLLIYRMDGEIAVPSGFFSTYSIPNWLPGVQPATGRWIWRDVNGDGDVQANEFSDADGVSTYGVWGWDVDDNGDVWTADEGEGVRRYPLLGIDAKGNPMYSRASSTLYGIPAPFTTVERVRYIAATDTLFVSGYTKAYPQDPHELNFGQAGTQIIRYDKWLAGNRTPAWQIVLPYNPQANITVKSIAVEGQLVIAGMFAMRNGSYVYLYDSTTGASLGQITPGPEVNTINGLIDGTQLVQAYQKGSEYLIFVEEVTWGKTLMYSVKLASPFTAHAPTADAVAPNASSGISQTGQTFTFDFTDQDGSADLNDVRMLFNSTLSTTAACAVTYLPESNTLSLSGNSGIDIAGTLTPGAGTISNSQCTLNGAASSVSAGGNGITVRLALTFAPAFLGAKNIYMQAIDKAGFTSGYQLRGTWTNTMKPDNQPPVAVGVTPNSGSGSSQTFTFTYSDPNGASDLFWVLGYLGTPTEGLCMVYYGPATQTMLLLDDTQLDWAPPLTPGVAGTAENSQCIVDAGQSSVTMSGNTLTFKVALTFKPAFAGDKHIFMNVLDNQALTTGNVDRGTWTVPGPAVQNPAAVSATPNTGSGTGQTFSFMYSDPKGYTNINWVSAYLSQGTSNFCYVYYARGTNTLMLLNDARSGWSQPLTPSVAGTAENSQCSLDAGKSSVSGSGNNLTLNLALSFKPAFAGPSQIMMYAVNNAGLNSDFKARGTWTVPGSSNRTPSAVSVTPASGTGGSQTFSFVYADPDGSNDLSWAVAMVLSPAGTNCFVYFERDTRMLLLLSDSGKDWMTPLTAGVAGTAQNSQCIVDGGGSSVVESGTNLTLNLKLSFKPAFSGAKSLNLYAMDNQGLASGWQNLGAWMVP